MRPRRPGRHLFWWAVGCVLGALFSTSVAAGETATPRDCVILLHGLARTAASMQPLVEALQVDYTVVNVAYPSRRDPIEKLAPTAVTAGLAQCRAHAPKRIHFVTHSLGGILLRYYLATQRIAELGRTVMLGPPNHGSEVVDHLRHWPGFNLLNGPAGDELGTDSASIPRRLGRANFELGIIAGTRNIEPYSSRYLPGANDGKVTVTSARLAGMQDFIALPVTHTFMMQDARVLAQVQHFLRSGHFVHQRDAD